MAKVKTPRWGWALTGSGHFFKECLAMIRDLQHGRQVRLRDFRQPRHQRVCPGRQMPGAGHRVRLRHRSRAGNRGAQGHGQGVSPPHRSREYRAVEILRFDESGRNPRRARAGAGRPQARARPVMTERILFLTGHLARPRLEKVLAGLGATDFEWSIFDVGVKVAALMTEAIIARRLPRPVSADRVVVPGRCRADLDRLAAEFGVPFERGPEELKDLPGYFGKGRDLDLSATIFAS